MRVKKVTLTNYRNYDHASVELSDKRNLLIGENAQGKTNFLEAIELACSGKSARASSDADLIKHGTNTMTVEVVFESQSGVETMTLTLNRNPDGKIERRLRLNGLALSSSRTLRGHLISVAFKSSDLNLLRGGPKFRRDWIDDILCTIKPAHAEAMAKYQKIILQRNRLLKQFFEKGRLFPTDIDQLKVWDVQAAQLGATLIKRRLTLLNELLPYAERHHKHISGSRERLTACYVFRAAEKEDVGVDPDDEMYEPDDYQIETKALNQQTEAEIATYLLKLMKERRGEEIARKQSLCGPHRDDIKFQLNDFDAIEYASQGQQRSLVLSCKLAELERVEEVLTEPPVLLLDDVLAELDLNRQSMLMNLVKQDMQTLITTTHISGFRPEWVEGALFLEVSGGAVRVIQESEAVV